MVKTYWEEGEATKREEGQVKFYPYKKGERRSFGPTISPLNVQSLNASCMLYAFLGYFGKM